MTKYILVLLLLLSPAAHAFPFLFSRPPDHWLLVGPMLSVSGRASGRTGDLEWGMGFEVAYNAFMKEPAGALTDVPHFLGAFGQMQWMSNGHVRLSGGIQLTRIAYGLEIGAMHETGTGTRLATTGLHLAPFIAFGVGSIGLRFGLPLAAWGSSPPGGTKRAHGAEAAFVLTLKAPIPLKSCRTLVCNLLY